MHYWLQSGERRLFTQALEQVLVSVSRDGADSATMCFAFADKQDFSAETLDNKAIYEFKVHPSVIADLGIDRRAKLAKTIGMLERLSNTPFDMQLSAIQIPQKLVGMTEAHQILMDTENTRMWFWWATESEANPELIFKASRYNRSIGAHDEFKVVIEISIPLKQSVRS